MNMRERSVAVLGLGVSGEAAAKLLARQGSRVTVFDDADALELAPKLAGLRESGVVLEIGRPVRRIEPGEFDLLILSPGIDPVSPLAQAFSGLPAERIGELELAFGFCAKPVIAITGTNGKTTTTQLVEAMLNRAGRRAIACGNIGLPLSAALDRQSEIDFFAAEVSSFQLETIRAFRPRVAVWLNFSPDHLDRYPSIEAYRRAKLRIFENLTEEDYAVVNFRDRLPPFAATRITFSAYDERADLHLHEKRILFQGDPILNIDETRLTGPHNAENLMAALGVGAALKIPWAEATRGLLDYQLPPHRCELVRTSDGVLYINDSKATNPDALAKALEAQTKPVILIAGGKDKGFAFQPLRELIRAKVQHAVLLGEMAPAMDQAWAGAIARSRAKSLREAVDQARAQAKPGSVVLFSPGTSSFDMFRDYADRGDQFRKIVQELTP